MKRVKFLFISVCYWKICSPCVLSCKNYTYTSLRYHCALYLSFFLLFLLSDYCTLVLTVLLITKSERKIKFVEIHVFSCQGKLPD